MALPVRDDAPRPDGRTARRDRNRNAVLDAVLELFAEDVLMPTVDQVADRSGVSLRSVYRYFEDTDELIRSAIARNLEKTLPLFAIDGIGEGDLDERIDRFVDSRLRLYEHIAPIARAAVIRAPTVPLVAETLDRARQRMHEQLVTHFEAEFEALEPAPQRAAVSAIDALFQFQTVDHLHRSLGLSTSQTRDVLCRAVYAMLGEGLA